MLESTFNVLVHDLNALCLPMRHLCLHVICSRNVVLRNVFDVCIYAWLLAYGFFEVFLVVYFAVFAPAS